MDVRAAWTGPSDHLLHEPWVPPFLRAAQEVDPGHRQAQGLALAQARAGGQPYRYLVAGSDRGGERGDGRGWQRMDDGLVHAGERDSLTALPLDGKEKVDHECAGQRAHCRIGIGLPGQGDQAATKTVLKA
jgi:hypothetical protein